MALCVDKQSGIIGASTRHEMLDIEVSKNYLPLPVKMPRVFGENKI